MSNKNGNQGTSGKSKKNEGESKEVVTASAEDRTVKINFTDGSTGETGDVAQDGAAQDSHNAAPPVTSWAELCSDWTRFIEVEKTIAAQIEANQKERLKVEHLMAKYIDAKANGALGVFVTMPDGSKRKPKREADGNYILCKIRKQNEISIT